ncbi:FG-GAP-like repeat-containing protein [Herbidospora sp. RD11066]
MLAVDARRWRRVWVVLVVLAALVAGQVTTAARPASAAPPTDFVYDYTIPGFDRAAAQRAYSSSYRTNSLNEIVDQAFAEAGEGSHPHGQLPPLPQLPANLPGTLQITDTGFRIVIPANQVEALATQQLTWGQTVLVLVASGATAAVAFFVCIGTLKAPITCKALAGAASATAGRLVYAKFAGLDMSTPDFWAGVLAFAIIGGVSGASLEFYSQFSKAFAEPVMAGIGNAIWDAYFWLELWIPTGLRAGYRASVDWIRNFLRAVGRAFPREMDNALQDVASRPSLRIMPMGDSITVGYGGTGKDVGYVGYRQQLLKQLRADGHSVDLVGSQSSGAGLIADTGHEGHGGWRIDQLDAIATCTIKRYRPNVVLLHIGTNDMNRNRDIENAHLRLGGLIRKITDAAPETTVLVTGIVTSLDAAINARIGYYNARIQGVVDNLVDEGKRVRVLSMGSITQADLVDKLHPGQAGYDKMGDRFYSAINRALADHVIADPVAGSSCDLPQPPSPSQGWNHVQQITAGYGYPRDWVRFGDLDGDNRDDYLILQDKGELRGWRNGGDGRSWNWWGELNAGYGYPRDWVRLADMDGDGRDDYVILQDLGEVRAWRNNGVGQGWGWWGELNAGYGYPRDWVRLEDVDGDGDDDYVVVQDQGQLRVWLNNGPGQGWTWKGEINAGYGYPRDWVRLEDVNADRKVDYLVVQDNGQVRAWLNNGIGNAWTWQGQIIGDVGVDRGNVRLTDVNGDRKADYLGIGPLGQIGAWFNDRYPGGPLPGNPPAPVDPPPPASPAAGWTAIQQLTAGYGYPRDWVRYADMDGDNRDDYLVLQDLGELRGWQNQGVGQPYKWWGELNPGYGYPRDWVRLADMDGDGRDDYVILQDLGEVRAWRNNGVGQGWGWWGELNPGYGYPRDWVRLEDINGDGRDDYVIIQDQGQLRAWLNNGPGNGWTWLGEISDGYRYPRDWVRLEDINGDRKVDYLVVQDDGEVRAWINDFGGKGWIWQGGVIGDVGVDRNNVRLADVNGDRTADYLGIGPLGQIGAWINNRYPGRLEGGIVN